MQYKHGCGMQGRFAQKTRKKFYEIDGCGQRFRIMAGFQDEININGCHFLCIMTGTTIVFYEFAQNLLH